MLNHFMRVIPNLCNLLTPLDEVLETEFIPALTDEHICSKEERLLLSITAKQGGLAAKYVNSKSITSSKRSNILLTWRSSKRSRKRLRALAY